MLGSTRVTVLSFMLVELATMGLVKALIAAGADFRRRSLLFGHST